MRKTGVGIMTENKKGKRVRGRKQNVRVVIDGCRKPIGTPWPENTPKNCRNRRRRRIVVIDKVT
jgi:hypothetical protein